MEIILLDKVRRLGDVGEKVNVKAGYGRNFLIPTGKAVPATAENLSVFEANRAELEKKSAEKKALADERASKLTTLSVTIPAKAGEEGKLFGSIGTRDIADAITHAGVEVIKSEVRLSEGLIRQAGDYAIEVHVHPDVTATVAISIVPE